MTPILHTLTNLLNPWRTIRRLEAENRRLEWQASDFIDKVSQLEWRNQLLKDELALPPLPEHLARREKADAGEAP